MCYTLPMTETVPSYFSFLECPVCQEQFNPEEIQTFCDACRSPLLSAYDLEKMKKDIPKSSVSDRRTRGVWRWHELLPVKNPENQFSLGEGDTPFLPLNRITASLDLNHVFVKDESQNPTGTFKARGLAVAVSKAYELGLHSLVLPTAGNAGGALAAYAARAGMEAHIYMPQDAPRVNREEVTITGAKLNLVDGLISDAAEKAAEDASSQDWFSMSTFKEPYRLEGKKTLGFELAEQNDWKLPDVIIYPTGGGTGLVGMWKAFNELEKLGWIDSRRPRMVSVQAAGCAPIVKAISEDAPDIQPWENAHTIADGLCVPNVFAEQLILSTLRESNGTAISVTDQEIKRAQALLGEYEGLFTSPEGAATLAAAIKLSKEGWLSPEEQIVLFNTGSGLKYVH